MQMTASVTGICILSEIMQLRPQGAVYRLQAAASSFQLGHASCWPGQETLRGDVEAPTCDVSRKERHLCCPANELHDQPLGLQSRMHQRPAFGSALVVGAMQLSMSLHCISILQHVGALSPVVDMPCSLCTVSLCKRQQLCICAMPAWDCFCSLPSAESAGLEACTLS